MKKYLYQRFLPNCNTGKIDLPQLYATNIENMKEISLSLLDEKIDIEEDLNNFLNQYKQTDILVINNDRPLFSNLILKEYSDKTLKSYLAWFAKKGFDCRWTQRRG